MSDDKTLTWREFLESEPPGSRCFVSDAAANTGSIYQLSYSSAFLWCDSDECAGEHWFDFVSSSPQVWWAQTGDGSDFCSVAYRCRHCKRNIKRFSILVVYDKATVLAGKVGELPSFGPPLPRRLTDLADNDRPLLIKGRRCENQGLGIGAFTYYRRVVENQRNRLLDEIGKVAKTVGGHEELLADIQAAKTEHQFQKSIDRIKHALPQVLMLNGENPLLLLHSALSDGVHNRTDDECLALATNVRVVLTALMDRISTAISDNLELKAAIGQLSKARSRSS